MISFSPPGEEVRQLRDSLKIVRSSRTPTVPERLEEIDELVEAADPRWEWTDLPAHEFLNFINETGLLISQAEPLEGQSIRRSLILASRMLTLSDPRTSYQKFVSQGGYRDLLALLRAATTQPPRKEVVWVPVLEIHCPQHAGCVAWVEHTVQRSWTSSLSVKVLGSGGGGTLEGDLTLTRKADPAQECRYLTVPVRVSIERRVVDGQPFTEVVPTDFDSVLSFGTRNIPKTEDVCQQTAEQYRSYGWVGTPYSFSGSSAGGEFQIELGRRRTYEFELGIDILVKASLKSTSKWSRRAKHGYHLAGRRDYLGFLSRNAVGMVWAQS